ncbi:MAG: leucine-rich repeat domain-containing protein [Saccharofermentans sp.]|nr:leucine-rich repeat domain-containing protein [Saccharofermentans sp.]
MQSIKVKVLTMFMSLVMAVAALPALNSNAATIISGKCGANASYVLSDDGTLKINGSGAIDEYVTYTNGQTSAPWYSKRSYIKRVVIGDGITRLGSNAFSWCTQIAEVQFSSQRNLTSIGTQTFYECYNLKSITLPAGLISVGRNAFVYSGLTSVIIPNTVKTIAYGAFANCYLTKVYIPASVVTIGDFAFRGNKQMVKFTGGAGVVTIGIQAFEHCWKLSNFVITSKKLKKIGKACFLCDSKLKTLYIKQTTKLTKKGVKNSLYLSSVKKVKVKKSKVKKYKKYFTYRNCAKRGVKVKK